MSDIASKIIKIASEQLSVEEAEIRPESLFQDDLGADSLELVELIMAMEEEFDVKIADEALDQIKTVQSAVDFVTGLRGQGAAAAVESVALDGRQS